MRSQVGQDGHLGSAVQFLLPVTLGQAAAGAPPRGPLSLLRSNMPQGAPAELWDFHLQLTQVEEAFKYLKSELSLRPFHHKRLARPPQNSGLPGICSACARTYPR